MKTTNISWCDSTASPWYGCTKVSAGCLNCYAAIWAKRYGKDCWGPKKKRIPSESFESNCRQWNREARRLRIFPSLCDWLDPKAPVKLLAEFLRIMLDCRNLDFLVLTKRPELWASRIYEAGKFLCVHSIPEYSDPVIAWRTAGRAPSNIWVGVSVENNETTNRINDLLKIPAAKRFISFEPLLEAISSLPYFGIGWTDWAIIGGESGPCARLCRLDWIRDLRNQLKQAGVPVFIKQLGSRLLVDDLTEIQRSIFGGVICDAKLADPLEWPADLRVQEMPR